MKPLALFIIVCFLCACGQETQHVTEQRDTVKTTPPPVSSTDTLVVSSRAAVFYSPDSIKIEKEKAINEDDFYTAADDATWYMYQSHQFMDSLKVKALEADRKYIKFVQTDGSYTVIAADTLSDLWGVYLFDPAKPPFKGDIVSIDESYKSYFQ